MTWNSAPPGVSSEGTMPEGLSEASTHAHVPVTPSRKPVPFYCILTTRG